MSRESTGGEQMTGLAIEGLSHFRRTGVRALDIPESPVAAAFLPRASRRRIPTRFPRFTRGPVHVRCSAWAGWLLAMALGLTGCDAPKAHFAMDRLYLDKMVKSEDAEVTPEQIEDIGVALTALFGTPDEPSVPVGDTGIGDVIDLQKLKMAAGPFGSDATGKAHGLFRQHCVHCHGVTGDGKGPTAAFLNPYPRDYRRGVFKFKSTPNGSRPTQADLKRILVNGIPGTSMPSFALLPDSEIEALVDYVTYLSIRGEMERRLIDEVCIELDPEDRLISDEDLADAGSLLLEGVGEVVAKWVNAESQMSVVPQRPEMDEDQLLASIERGKQLFFGTVANCTKCHGDSQLGDGQLTDYDDWAKDYAEDWIQQSDLDDEGAKKKRDMLTHILELDGLPPRTIRPRDLRSGVYRGGRRPIDLYRRILNGIDGSPMPAAMLRRKDPSTGEYVEATGLSSEAIWDIVNYVLSLPYESMMTENADAPIYSRDRM